MLEDKPISTKEIVGIVITELEKRNIIKRNLSTFKNTEQLLFDYPKLKESIKDRKEQIKDYQEYGLPGKSKSITSINSNSKKEDVDDIISNSISSLKKDIYRTEVVIKFIDTVLQRFKNDPYYEMIKLYFFERKTYEQIAAEFDKRKNNGNSIAISTLASNKNRIVRELQKYIFPNDYLYQMLGYWQSWKRAENQHYFNLKKYAL